MSAKPLHAAPASALVALAADAESEIALRGTQIFLDAVHFGASIIGGPPSPRK
jgi:hypothetical protein